MIVLKQDLNKKLGQGNLARAMKRIKFRTERRKCAKGLFIDFSNAYNNIPYYLLFKKLRAKKNTGR